MKISIILLTILTFGYLIYHKILTLLRILSIKTSIYDLVVSISNWLKKRIQLFAYGFFCILFISITYFQDKYNFPIYNLEKKNLIEVLGFLVAILGLYGIYIGFLQYLTDHNEGNMFLGKSKVNYLIDNSIWYQITQSRFFFALLILAIIIPILFKQNDFVSWLNSNQYSKQLQYIWQTVIVLLLTIYIFLLRMSLEIIYITLLMKTGSDSGLQYIMKREIQEVYEKTFWRSYIGHNNSFELTKDMLDRDLKKIKLQELDEYLAIVFKGIDEEFFFHTKKKFWKDTKIDDLSKFYIQYIQGKWDFLSDNIDKISYVVLENMVTKDIQHIHYFEEKLNKRLAINGGNSFYKKYVTEYLFDQLLKKANTDLKNIINRTVTSTKYLQISGKLTETEKNKLELEKYMWKEIFSKYVELKSDEELPKLRKKSNDNLDEENRIDPYNSDLYSQTCFEFLENNYGRVRDNLELNNFLKSLICSMNDEYLVAYCLYQLLCNDDSDAKINFPFYNSVLKKNLNVYEESEFKYFFDFAKNVIINTNISHRLSEDFFNKLWLTREQTITNLESWYRAFGKQHRVTPFVLLYIQSLFTSKFKNSYESRVSLSTKKVDVKSNYAVSICREYLELLVYNPEMKEDISSSIKELFFTENFEYSKVLDGVDLISILYFESMLKYDFWYLKKWKYQHILLKCVELMSDDEKVYYFRNDDIMNFFVLKMIDPSYDECFKIINFKMALEEAVKNFLIKNDMDIPNYIEKIYKKLKKYELIKISTIEKNHIINELQKTI